MNKRTLIAVAGLFSISFLVSGQVSLLPNPFAGLDGTSLRVPSLALADRSPFAFPNALETSEIPAFLPALPPSPDGKVTVGRVSARDSSKEISDTKAVVQMKKPFFDYATGEIGAFYGHSSGKFSTDYEAGYLMGTVGNDKMQISAGASYEHSDTNYPRRH